MKMIRKILGILFISAGVFMLARAVFEGLIDFYPSQNYIQESPLQELLNIGATVALIAVPILLGFFLLVRNRYRSGR
ncbi:MAG: hypothetical protein K9G67_02685 [Bacteroidales bacterium]|nr:hypothetical protein [Bacteroidales bacterium]MCF8343773.1 hypothetical protein [Bacteroidales bacterium]MCF8351638.1 hypothetical protein [Bacteroidales bacterium]MCF8375234.1 hypothetical protein [Bacteroidales bacterium]MCF8400258.1 hypothetical protein [Bacteroidales bacterium]